jgi:hypothetical protein
MGVMSQESGRETAMILPHGSSSNTGTDFGCRNDTDDVAPAAPHVHLSCQGPSRRLEPLPFLLGFLYPLSRSLASIPSRSGLIGIDSEATMAASIRTSCSRRPRGDRLQRPSWRRPQRRRIDWKMAYPPPISSAHTCQTTSYAQN